MCLSQKDGCLRDAGGAKPEMESHIAGGPTERLAEIVTVGSYARGGRQVECSSDASFWQRQTLSVGTLPYVDAGERTGKVCRREREMRFEKRCRG